MVRCPVIVQVCARDSVGVGVGGWVCVCVGANVYVCLCCVECLRVFVIRIYVQNLCVCVCGECVRDSVCACVCVCLYVCVSACSCQFVCDVYVAFSVCVYLK